ncbi:adenosylcobinamide-phosphate synthase CbiB [Gilvimarinus algae]|uniref:Cobalamin biosynthesis protein CobD n=1 Tax=Gilvimarinus algae TaxID=3058037 RepID=A0ABT8TE24_9GAMM|nr:adenosylcobinamide-phosphate synthase CbiB [Gilvimarinus sp. SDUM040014]MDO3381804.1 adenosylcobinamide-phosphate synthase CbiB [Gilvimarinus sp. SDUM040014]
MLLAAALWFGFALDSWLGEPRRWHPLVGFGRLAGQVEARLNRGSGKALWWGALALSLLLLPVLLASAMLWWWLLADHPLAALLTGALGLYFALGWHSLNAHAVPIAQALQAERLPAAREVVARIVSRDCDNLSESDTARAAIESLLENTSDAVVGPLFWFVIAGLPGVLVYRLSNTLDAMWGYRTQRYRYFGWAAARLDDLLNLLPARLCALAFAAAGDAGAATRQWRASARHWSSPNAGVVIAAGAGALGLALGGGASYHGVWQDKPATAGREPQAADITLARRLARRAVLLVVLMLSLAALALEGFSL